MGVIISLFFDHVPRHSPSPIISDMISYGFMVLAAVVTASIGVVLTLLIFQQMSSSKRVIEQNPAMSQSDKAIEKTRTTMTFEVRTKGNALMGVPMTELLLSDVWASNASVIYPRNFTRNDMMAERPFLCSFQNVFVDSGRIYFVAKEFDRGSKDLFRCCVDVDSDEDYHNGRRCENSSVQLDLCYCFHSYKYVPSVISLAQWHEMYYRSIKKLDGKSWVMHHWSVWKHPDHFTMKLLEFLALMTNKNVVGSDFCYDHLPESIDHLVSMDYFTENLTDYESTIMNIVMAGLNRSYDITSLNHNPHVLEKTLFDHGRLKTVHKWMTYVDNKSLNLSLPSVSTEPLPLVYTKMAFMSPRYKNNIPIPAHISQLNLQKSMFKAGISTDENNRSSKRVIVVLQRNEGSGLRRFVNMDDVLRTVNNVFESIEIRVWYINAATPARTQLSMFRDFDLMIAPHSSQLTNLVFSKTNCSVIEIQQETQPEERSFINLGHKVGLHYQLIRSGNTARNPFHWSLSDTYISIPHFKNACMEVKRRWNRKYKI